MWIKLVTACAVLGAGTAAAQAPLSAIDWLSDSVASPPQSETSLPPVDPLAAPEVITVSPLGAPSFDAVGLLPPSVTGFPADFWGASQRGELARLIAQPYSGLPAAARDLLHTVLLAELTPPQDDGQDGQLFLARLDKLLEYGAIEQAQALLERAGPVDPALFRRWFDVSLLTGREDRACAAMRANPGIAPTFPARIFCLARGGDWNAAALSLETGKALGFITEEEDALLIRFLDPVFADEEPPLPRPTRPSPLVFRMFEAIGQPLATTALPVAFAHADLRPVTGWKAQIEAAERLARRGAIPANRLLGVYSARSPAASGALWDRVAAVQKLDVALLTGDGAETGAALEPAWQAMRAAGLAPVFARIYGERLSLLELPPDAAELAAHVGLLSSDYERIAVRNAETLPFLSALATGQPLPEPKTPLQGAVVAGFADGAPDDMIGLLLAENRQGEVLFHALSLLASAATGEASDLARGLAALRLLGLEDTARRTALEILVLGAQE